VIFCAPGRVDYTVVGGKVVVEECHLRTIDLPELVENHNRAARRLLSGD